MNSFRLTRIYSDEKGDSHFGKVDIPLNPSGEIGFLSDGIAAKQVIFRKVLPSYDYDFHNAPQKQYLVLLDGIIRIETSLGEVRDFVAGDVLLLEDTTGKGHRTKNLVEAERSSIFITLP